ncbi:GTPase Era, partial [Candidatus Shapirobacteria bacterium CG03_land_8_20_14_0_80_35_14]
MKYGKVAIVGRPNTGKSTLINAIMNQKVSITSPLPQTTRRAQTVLFSDDRGKILFTDTPGLIGKVVDLMSKRVNEEIPRELAKTDLVVAVVDISRPKNEEENKVLGLLRKINTKKILVYNKIDQAVGPANHFPDYNYLEDEFDKTVMVSGLKSKNVKTLVNLIFELLPQKENRGVMKEIEAMSSEVRPLTAMGAREYISEIIREKAYLFLREEIPYTINVKVKEVVDKKKLIYIKAEIITSADRYKKMIIGTGGKKIREIGYNARKELELMSARKVFLDLTVVVD